MMQLQVRADRLSEDFERALKAANEGTEVLVEQDGEIVARLVPRGSSVDWVDFQRTLRETEPLGEPFGEAVLAAVAAGNAPPQDAGWAS